MGPGGGQPSHAPVIFDFMRSFEPTALHHGMRFCFRPFSDEWARQKSGHGQMPIQKSKFAKGLKG
jgi:hypothetical protein